MGHEDERSRLATFEVVTQKRTLPSSLYPQIPVPAHDAKETDSVYLQDCLQVYTRDWTIVKNKIAAETTSLSTSEKSRIGSMSPRGGTSRIEPPAQASLPAVIADFTSDESRKQTGVFDVYRVRPSADKTIGRLYNIESPFQEKPSTFVVFEVRDLKVPNIGTSSGSQTGSTTPRGKDFEPLFTTVTLYDVKYKERRSETFHWIHNPELVSDLVPQTIVPVSVESKPEKLEKSNYTMNTSQSHSLQGGAQALLAAAVSKLKPQISGAPPSRTPPTPPSRTASFQNSADFGLSTTPSSPSVIPPLNVKAATPTRPERPERPDRPPQGRFERTPSHPTLATPVTTTSSNVPAEIHYNKAACLFSIEDPHPGLYAIIKVGRLLRPEAEKAKDKEAELSHKELEELCSTPAKFVQIVAWGAFPLFSDGSGASGSVAQGVKWHPGKEDSPMTLYAVNQPFNDETMFQLISNEKDLKKQKVYSSECYISVRRFADDARGKISEVHSFFPKQNAVLHYVNLLYFYPSSLRLPKLKTPNIVMRVRIKDDDSDPNSEGLLAIYARGSQIPNETVATSSVSFHEKRPYFTDEMKIQLPYNLNKKHHLLVTYHNVTPKKEQSVLLGYSVIPLYKNNRVIREGESSIGVVQQLPPNYLSSSAIKWIDPKKAFISFRTRIHSSIYPQEERVQDFFLQYASDNCSSVVVGLRVANPTVCINFFPVLFDQLLRIICGSNDVAGKEAFVTLLSILPSPSNIQLLSYVEYLFDNPKPAASKFVHEEICKLWIYFLCEEKLNPIVERFPNSLNWFLLFLIRKSMVLYLRDHKGPFPLEYLRNLSKLMGVIVQGSRCSTLDQAISVATFLKDLLYILDPTLVYDMIEICMSGFQKQEATNSLSQLLKLTFIRVVTEHEGYLPLMIPDSASQVFELGITFKKTHYLTYLLLNEVHGSISLGDVGRRRQGIETLRDLLRKHAFDKRFSGVVEKQRIAALYFPLITGITENFSGVKSIIESRSEDSVSLLIAIAHIIKETSRDLLKKWWVSKPQKVHLGFLTLLEFALTRFEDQILIAMVHFIVLDVISLFMRECSSSEGDQEINPLVEKYFILIRQMMQSTHEPSLFALFDALDTIVTDFSRIIFTVRKSPFCEELCIEALRHCNSAYTPIRGRASKFLFALIKKNQTEVGNISRVKLQSTVALSKLVGMGQTQQTNSFDNLEISLQEIAYLATSEGSNPSIAAEITTLTSRLISIVRESRKISENSQDPEMLEDLYCTIMAGYINSPDIRTAWLESLANLHERNSAFAEAAQCKIFIASLVLQYIKYQMNNKIFHRTDMNDLASIAPNILREPELSEEAISEGSEAFGREVWTYTGFFDIMKDASDLLEQAELYELSIQIYEVLAPIHRIDKNFVEMHSCYQKMQELCNKLIETEKKAKDRLFPSYFRVAFFGKRLGEMDGKEFIYKEKPRTVLGNITERIKQQLNVKYPSVPIVVLSNSKPVDGYEFKADTLYIQVANVKTHFYGADERVTEFDRHFDVRRFIFEMGFTSEGGKGQTDDLSKQQKKKIIFTVASPFPDIKKRQIVIKKEEVIISPIENALELINDKIRAIREILETTPPNKNKLQQLLTGTVMTMVNAGPVALCESFLAKDQVSKFPIEHVRELKKRMDYFVLLCAFAVKLHKGVVGSEQQELHNQYESKFAILKMKIKQFTDLPDEEQQKPQPGTSLLPTTKVPTLMIINPDKFDTLPPLSSLEKSPRPSSLQMSTSRGVDVLMPDLDRKVRNSTLRSKEARRIMGIASVVFSGPPFADINLPPLPISTSSDYSPPPATVSSTTAYDLLSEALEAGSLDDSNLTLENFSPSLIPAGKRHSKKGSSGGLSFSSVFSSKK